MKFKTSLFDFSSSVFIQSFMNALLNFSLNKFEILMNICVKL
jgi:hypothetical protein